MVSRTGQLTTTALSGVIGTEVAGVDLSVPLSDDVFVAVHDAFLASGGVLVFRDQFLSPAALTEFGARWGELIVNPYLADKHGVPGYPAVLLVENVGKEKTPTERWHSDWIFLDAPPAITIVAAEQLPPAGGDTMWANQYVAHELLSPGMQRLLATVRGVFPGSQVSAKTGELEHFLGVHPIVRTHPETGRKSLLVAHPGDSLLSFEDMSPEESRPLLDFLYGHATRPDVIYRHHWRPGDVVMWDNRCTLHYAVHDFGDDVPRVLNRVTLRPEPVD
jgi:taurine dioxygenase